MDVGLPLRSQGSARKLPSTNIRGGVQVGGPMVRRGKVTFSFTEEVPGQPLPKYSGITGTARSGGKNIKKGNRKDKWAGDPNPR